jgi:selenocysteine lyase/cysteine desulfurase
MQRRTVPPLSSAEESDLDSRFEELRRTEFARLDRNGQVYLDYTGSGLYGESQIGAHAEFLRASVFGNPHSRNPTSRAATGVVEGVRERVLAFFDADPDEYEVVFTLNASHALKLVGESFPFSPTSRFVLTADNHNSAHGIREYAATAGAEVHYITPGPELRCPGLETRLPEVDPAAPSLFVFPAQSNFSGVKHPLGWIDCARRRGYQVFLDTAAFVPTTPLSIRETRPDFAAISFYKMFGYPTGVGVLLARRESLALLRRPWFGGGTVRFVSAQPGVVLPWHTGRGFEDGTLNFLDIAAIPVGLDFLESIGMENVHRRVRSLTASLLESLATLRHGNGEPLVRLYGPPTACADRGGTIAFNLLDPDGALVDFRDVEERASAAGVSLRTGYFCNPGAAEYALQHDADEVRRCAGTFTPESWSLQEFADCLHEGAVGAVRVSLGIATNRRDLDRLVDVLRTFLG